MEKLYVVNQLFLGERELGYELWNGKEVIELTSKAVKNEIKAGKEIYGLTLNQEKDSLELDERFYTRNLMCKRHIGKLQPLMNQNCITNLFYIVLGSRIEEKKVVYDCISSRFEQLTLEESEVKAYLRLGIISGGAKLEEEKIVLAMQQEKTTIPPTNSKVVKVEEKTDKKQ